MNKRLVGFLLLLQHVMKFANMAKVVQLQTQSSALKMLSFHLASGEVINFVRAV
jgi:hypothetical protein